MGITYVLYKVTSCYNILCTYVRMCIHKYSASYIYNYIYIYIHRFKTPYRCNNIIMTGAQYTEYGQLRVNYICIIINAPLSTYLPSIRKTTPYVHVFVYMHSVVASSGY